MATALPWLGYQHTLTRMIPSWREEAGIIIVVLLWDMEVDQPHDLMMFGRMMFGKVVGLVCVARLPKMWNWPCCGD